MILLEEQVNNPEACKKVEDFLEEYIGLIVHPEQYPSIDVLYRLAFDRALKPWRDRLEQKNQEEI